MSKKKKKLSDKPKKKKFKIKKLIKPLIFLLIIGSGVAIWKPDLIQDETQRARVEEIRETALDYSEIGQEVVEKRLQVLGSINEATKSVPKKMIQVGDQEIYVEDLLRLAAAQLETIPSQQYQQFKSTFCADAVATVSACVLQE